MKHISLLLIYLSIVAILVGKSQFQIPTPLVLQVSKVRNVSAPKAFEESGTAPRLLRMALTDGFSTVHALEIQNIKPLR